MAITIGIDLGGSTTDIVGFEEGSGQRTLLASLTVRADDPVSSAAGALGRYLVETGRTLKDIRTLAVTGVGAGALGDQLLGLPLVHVDEFRAIGRGGVYLSGVDQAIVASLGTGTAFVVADGNSISHWGGSGVGGGTLMGLSKALFGISDIDLIARKAADGNLDKVDLSVGDIAARDIPGLPPETTAANFAKMADDAEVPDMAMAIVNLVCQTVGVIASAVAKCYNKTTIILIGKLASFPSSETVFTKLGKFNGYTYVISPKAAFATAVGAAVEALNVSPYDASS